MFFSKKRTKIATLARFLTYSGTGSSRQVGVVADIIACFGENSRFAGGCTLDDWLREWTFCIAAESFDCDTADSVRRSALG